MKLFSYIRSFLAKALAELKRLFGRSASKVAPTCLNTLEQDKYPDRPPIDFSALPEPILSIDLGSAYTKVAFRPQIFPGQSFTEESKELILDDTALIPSIVLRDPAGTWHFGKTAAGLKPIAGWQAWENWKKALLDSDDPPDTAIVVATNFLSWLRGRIQTFVPDIGQTRVRIALPAFENFGRKSRLLKECMAKAGWNPDLVKPVREPHANIIGLMCRGKNHVTWPANGNTPSLNYGRMLGHNGLLQLAQNFYTNGTRSSRYLKGIVLDIGAYTTDIAPMIIDLAAEISHYGDGIEVLNPTSSRLGISAELDDPLFRELLSLSAFDRSQVTFGQFELLKEVLYKGEKYVDTNEKGEITIGTNDHQQLFDSHFERFAGAVWATLAPVAAQHKPEWIALTGGGNCITRLSQKIRQRIESAGFKVGTLGDGATRQSQDAQGISGLTTWSETGGELKRLATALGAVSPILDVPSNSPCTSNRDWLAEVAAEKPSADPQEVQCQCKGLNPDCNICDGRGYLPRR